MRTFESPRELIYDLMTGVLFKGPNLFYRKQMVEFIWNTDQCLLKSSLNRAALCVTQNGWSADESDQMSIPNQSAERKLHAIVPDET